MAKDNMTLIWFGFQMSTVVSSSSDCVENTACRLRKIGSGTSLHTTRTVTTPSANINNNAIGSANSGPNNSSSANKQCCFHWCCCCRPCSCLAVKAVQEEKPPEDPKGPEKKLITADESPPSIEEIRLWGDSFDRLMKSQAGRHIFREFLRCEYSEENILFWEACEDLKKETNPNVVEERARFIYEDFISILSPKEVSLDSKVRDLINKNMNSPTIHTFDEAQTQIYTLMHRDSYPRFLNSDKYKKLLNPPSLSENDSDSMKGSIRGSTKDSSSRASSVRRKKSET